MMLAASAAAGAGSGMHALLQLAALFTVIAIPSLLLWSALGALLAGWLARGNRRIWLDRGAGALLLVAAIGLLP